MEDSSLDIGGMQSVDDVKNIHQDFICAVIKGDVETVSALANKVCIDQPNYHGVTPLCIAIENSNVEMIRTLVALGADINCDSYCYTEGYTETPLATAVRIKQREIVELLLGYGCRMLQHSGFEGKSAFHWTASYGDVELAQILLNYGADINHNGLFLQTALHYAVIAGEEEMVTWLLYNRAKFLENADKRNALHIASIHGNTLIVACLLDYGCSYNIRDQFGFLPFGLACLRGHLDVVKLIVEKTSGNVDLNDGLLHAAESGYLAVIEYLVKCGAQVNFRNANGETPLSVAAARGQYQVVLLLLSHGAQINVIDSRKYSPLLQSMLREHIDLVTTLVIHCGDFSLLSETPESPARTAYSLRHPMLLKLFLLAGLDVVNEPWFRKQNLEAELKDSDFTVAASRRNVWETRMVKESWMWLQNRVQRPLKLKEICRISIRRQLSKVTDGRSILWRMEELPFPKKLVEYLKFSELLLE